MDEVGHYSKQMSSFQRILVAVMVTGLVLVAIFVGSQALKQPQVNTNVKVCAPSSPNPWDIYQNAC